jgi:hypothetical protein
LTATNLTGHPALILPNGLRGAARPLRPRSTTATATTLAAQERRSRSPFLAGHYQDAKLAAFAWSYQRATGFHKLHPRLDG